MDANKISIGNVSFFKSDVKSSTTIHQNGEKLNCVFLQNGTKITFKDQDKNARAGVKTGTYGGTTKLGGQNGTGFFGIKGLTVEGSKKDDFYHLTNCDDFDVDVRGGGNDEVQVFNNNGKSVNGVIHRDGGDEEIIKDGGIIDMNEGLFMRFSNK